MRAVGYFAPGPVTAPDSLRDIELPRPSAAGRDLLVEVRAVSVNPVDYKVRASAPAPAGAAKVIGWDAAGIVVEAGPQASLFRAGEEVFYAGSIARPGTNAQFHLVDERIVGHKPRSLGFAEAAALPLTSITAWEALFDRIDIRRPVPGAASAVLIIGGAGGVGSIAIQLAKQLGRQTVIATASRPASIAWCRDLGADHVVDHGGDLVAQVRALGIKWVDAVFCCNSLDQHFAAIAELLAPQGRVCSIVEHAKPLPLNLLRPKCGSFVWEAMFARSTFETADMIEQHGLLDACARLVDSGGLRTTLSEVLGTINAANLRRAHAALEGGHTVGKLVLAGF